MEEWRDVLGYEGIYEASSLGRIRRSSDGRPPSPSKKGQIRVPHTNPRSGYLQVTLCDLTGKHKGLAIHKAVMRAFHGMPPAGKEVNHKNGIKTDNRLENLEYVTKSENNLHKCRVLGEHRGEKHHGAKLTEQNVREIRVLIASGLSDNAIAHRFGVISGTTVYGIRKGHYWTHVV